MKIFIFTMYSPHGVVWEFALQIEILLKLKIYWHIKFDI